MVKKKRARGIPYFDSIDLEILQLLDGYPRNKKYGIYGILDLADKLNISHISLKPHIDKLLDLELIRLIPFEDLPKDKRKEIDKKNTSKVGVCSAKLINDNWLENVADFENKNERDTIELVQKQNRMYDELLFQLEHIQKFVSKKRTEGLFEIDLRKLETREKYGARK